MEGWIIPNSLLVSDFPGKKIKVNTNNIIGITCSQLL